MTVNEIYNKVEDKIGQVFAAYGGFVADHAVKVLVVTIVVNVLLGAGMIKMRKQSNTDEIYFPMGK